MHKSVKVKYPNLHMWSKNGPSAISPSTSFVFITKFGFRPIRITLNSWETKIRNLQIKKKQNIYGHMDVPLLMTQQLFLYE